MKGRRTLRFRESRSFAMSPSFTKYPYDIVMSVCRQCVTPLCVQNCPTGACHVDAANGNIRGIDEEKCIGCNAASTPARRGPTELSGIPAKKNPLNATSALTPPTGAGREAPMGAGLRQHLSGESA